MEITRNDMFVFEDTFKYFGYDSLSKVYHKLNEWDLKLPNTKEFSSFNLKEDLSKKTEAVEGSSK